MKPRRCIEIVVKPGKQSYSEMVDDFWQSRELLYILTWRQIILRYKQTVLGVAWVLIQPLVAMTLLAVIFGHFAKLPTDGIPYPLFYLSGMIFWSLFAEGANRAANSFVGNENFITKVYFSRLVIPLSAVFSAFVDFFIAALLLAAIGYYYGFSIKLTFLFLPLAAAIAFCTAFGVGLLVATLNVRYRDFKYILPFVFQLWFFASPVIYSTSMIPRGDAKFYFHLNPVASIIELARYAISGTGPISVPGVMLSIAASIFFIFIGLLAFRSTEKSFSDYI
ncbi:MAG: ABC transporter permease [Patescibacteria group bacterium]|jgi:lipopolysaccharide transport system permease protein